MMRYLSGSFPEYDLAGIGSILYMFSIASAR